MKLQHILRSCGCCLATTGALIVSGCQTLECERGMATAIALERLDKKGVTIQWDTRLHSEGFYICNYAGSTETDLVRTLTGIRPTEVIVEEVSKPVPGTVADFVNLFETNGILVKELWAASAKAGWRIVDVKINRREKANTSRQVNSRTADTGDSESFHVLMGSVRHPHGYYVGIYAGREFQHVVNLLKHAKMSAISLESNKKRLPSHARHLLSEFESHGIVVGEFWLPRSDGVIEFMTNKYAED